MSANPCAVTDALANDYAKGVTAVNRKFNALQRLAELLEQLGDVAGALPNLSSLVPLYLIDLSTYENLVQACPFLNLPKSPSTQDLAKLQAQVASAYSNIIKSLNLHPFIRMEKLQAQMTKVQGRLNETLNSGTEFMQCLQQACASASSVNQAAFQKQLDQFQRNYLARNGQVLSEPMQGKVSVVRGMIDNINELLTAAPVTSAPAAPVVPQVAIPTDHPVPLPPDGPVI